MDARAPIPAPDALYTPPPSPSLARLAKSPILRKLHMFRAIWRTSRNFLNLYHPEVTDRRWLVTKVGPEVVVSVNDADLARQPLVRQ